MTDSRVGVRWARGFFRAWVAFSVVWATIVFAFTVSDLPTEDSPVFTVAGGTEQYRISEVIKKAEEWSSVGDEQAAQKLLEVAAVKQAELDSARAGIAYNRTLIALSIPAALLLFGLVAAWMLRGFRNEEVK